MNENHWEEDRERTEHDRAQADAIEEGSFNEHGGELGLTDWEEALAWAASEVMAG